MRRILFPVLLAIAPSCVQVEGGAVEASWVLRADDGRAINDCGCADPAVTWVRVTLVGDSGEVQGTLPCKDRTACGFPCGRRTGVTPFDIPPGMYLIGLVPTDGFGNDLTKPSADGMRHPIQVPAPVLREVVSGQPVQLDAFQLVARCAPACGQSDGKTCK